MIRHLGSLPILLLAVSGLLRVADAEANPIGLVVQKQYQGAIGMIPGGAEPEQLTFESPVHANENIQTTDGSTALRFVDSTDLTIGSHSSVVLDRFIYDPDTTKRDSLIKIAKGVLRLTSGSRPHNGDMSISTPVAVLSIRGTDVIVDVANDGSMTATVLAGLVEVKTCNGTTKLLHKGQKARVNTACLIMLESASHEDNNVGTSSDSGVALGAGPGDSSSSGGGSSGSSSGGSSGSSGGGSSSSSGGGSSSSGGDSSSSSSSSSGGGSTSGGTNRSGGSDGTNPGGHGNSNGSNNPGGSKG